LFRSSHSSYPQVCSPALRSIARNHGPFCSTADRSDTIGVECFGSIQGDCVPSQFSKPYLMYSATDTASAALDFSKGNVEDRALTVFQIIARGERLSVRHLHYVTADRPPFDSVHVRQRITTYVRLKGSFIARHHSTWLKPKRMIMSITASTFP
jgi:hypothetical protein